MIVLFTHIKFVQSHLAVLLPLFLGLVYHFWTVSFAKCVIRVSMRVVDDCDCCGLFPTLLPSPSLVGLTSTPLSTTLTGHLVSVDDYLDLPFSSSVGRHVFGAMIVRVVALALVFVAAEGYEFGHKRQEQTFSLPVETTTTLDGGGGSSTSLTSTSTSLPGLPTVTPTGSISLIPTTVTSTSVVLTTSTGSEGTTVFSTTLTSVFESTVTSTAFPSLSTYTPCGEFVWIISRLAR